MIGSFLGPAAVATLLGIAAGVPAWFLINGAAGLPGHHAGRVDDGVRSGE